MSKEIGHCMVECMLEHASFDWQAELDRLTKETA